MCGLETKWQARPWHLASIHVESPATAAVFLLARFQIDICHRLAQQERSFGSEVVLGVRQVRGLDDRDLSFAASHLVQRGVDGVHVAPRGVFVLLGDEPRQIVAA